MPRPTAPDPYICERRRCSITNRRLHVVAGGLALVSSAHLLAGQDTARVTPSPSDTARPGRAPVESASATTGRVVSPCDGHVVHAITLSPRTPYYAGFAGQWRPLAKALTAVHAVTRPSVIRDFLALEVGEPCTELRRQESERILRAQPFLAEVRVTAYDDGRGGVTVAVVTADEVSLVGGLAVRSPAPHFTEATLGEGNLSGEGIGVRGDWADGLGLRDRYSGRVIDYAAFGRPWELALDGTRDVLGGYWTATLVHPFFSDLQRWAWIAQAGDRRTYVNFLNSATPLPPLLDIRRRFAQVGAISRVQGSPGHLELFGLSASQESAAPGTQPVVVPPGEASRPDTIPGLVARYAELNATRLNAIVGVRDIRFIRVRGFDALSGEQDLMLGTEVGLLAGHSLSLLGGSSKDVLLGSGAYAGFGGPQYLVAVQGLGEARDDLTLDQWDDIFISGRGALYWKPALVHTVIVSEEYSVGVDSRIPFALSFADPRGGVRGFENSLVTGGERSVTRFEERWLLGPVKNLGEVGLAGFTDVGRMWAEGVPYGVNSPTAVGVGFSLLAAVPVHSKRLWRIDFAFPVTRDPNARFEMRFSSTNGAERFYIEPRDIALARTQTVPTQIFEYPAQ